MPKFPNWTLSQQSRDRLSELLKSAGDLGLDPGAVAAGGLAALQAFIALKRANDAGEGADRAQSLARVQEALRRLDPVAHGDLLQQIQSLTLALQGRNGDTEVAHVTPGASCPKLCRRQAFLVQFAKQQPIRTSCSIGSGSAAHSTRLTPPRAGPSSRAFPNRTSKRSPFRLPAKRGWFSYRSIFPMNSACMGTQAAA